MATAARRRAMRAHLRDTERDIRAALGPRQRQSYGIEMTRPVGTRSASGPWPIELDLCHVPQALPRHPDHPPEGRDTGLFARRSHPGIVHFGVGNFHRAHQAVYLDALFNRGEGRDWAIIGAGVRDADKAMRQTLMDQDWLTTVVNRRPTPARPGLRGLMVDYLSPGDAAAVISRLADPAIRIVSLTINRGRLLHRSGQPALRSVPSRHCLGRCAHGRAAHRPSASSLPASSAAATPALPPSR